jgi:molybdate transport system substrate-binding protein
MGIVYRTDVRVSDDIAEVAVFPDESHPPIRYVGGVVQGASDDAHAFWAAIQGPLGQAALAEAGFLPASVAVQ